MKSLSTFAEVGAVEAKCRPCWWPALPHPNRPQTERVKLGKK